MESIINDYNQDKVAAREAKSKLVELASSDRLYKNYLENDIADMTIIRTNEILIYTECGIRVSESKNRCKMVESGHRYEKRPVWSESNHPIGNNMKMAVTDQAVYMLLMDKAMRYPFSKIVNLGYDDKWRYVYFDVKTTSPYPHRFSIRANTKKEKNKEANIGLLIQCLMGN